MSGKIFLGLPDVAKHLVPQLFQRIKPQLRPEEVEEFHPQLPAVEVPFIVEKEALHRQVAAVVHRGADADVGHRIVAGAVLQNDLGGVNSVGGHQYPLGNTEIHRGKTQRGTQTLAVGHGIRQDMGVAQETDRLGHLPLGDEGADMGGGDRDAVELHPGNDITAQPQFGTDGIGVRRSA